MSNFGQHIGRLLAARGGTKRVRPIGIDLGSQYLKLVQFLPKPESGVSVVAKTVKLSASIQEDWRGHLDELASLIKTTVRSGGFVGRQVVGCIPDESLEYRNVRLTPVSEKDLDSAVQSYVGHQLELSADLFKTQFFDAGTVWDDDDRRQEIIAMVAPLEVISDYLSVLKYSGLSAVAIDAVPAAIARSIAFVTRKETPQIVLDVGYRWTSLVIISQNEIRFVKRFSAGSGALDQEVARKLHIPLEEAEQFRESLTTQGPEGAKLPAEIQQTINTIVEEHDRQLGRDISKCLQYYSVTFRTSKPQAGIVLGGATNHQALIRMLSQSTRVEFRSPVVLGGVDWTGVSGPSDSMAPTGSWAVAAGLAQYLNPNQSQGAAA